MVTVESQIEQVLLHTLYTSTYGLLFFYDTHLLAVKKNCESAIAVVAVKSDHILILSVAVVCKQVSGGMFQRIHSRFFVCLFVVVWGVVSLFSSLRCLC